MTRFAGLKTDFAPASQQSAELPRPRSAATASDNGPSRRPAREGKKGILGHFSPELSRALNIMAAEEDTSVQALMGEAFDLLMRARGKHPFGER
jgi:hypothetical protein